MLHNPDTEHGSMTPETSHWTQLGPTSTARAGVNISHSLHRTDWIFRSDYLSRDCHFLNQEKVEMNVSPISPMNMHFVNLEGSPDYQSKNVPPWP